MLTRYIPHVGKVIGLMPQSLAEYAQWLSERDLRWPAPPKLEPIAAAPFLKPLPGIKAVAWDVYGTLLRIADGELLFVHPQSLRMEVALDKTIQEFNMWHSMSRKPGKPWEYMLQLYKNAYDDLRLAGSGRKGDLPEINAAHIWYKILEKLAKNDYQYDENQYGDLDDLSQKIAYFYHSSLQGWEAAAGSAAAVTAVAQAGMPQGLLADGQCFTPTQVLRGLEAEGKLPETTGLISPDLSTLSFVEGVRKPSKSLYVAAAKRFRDAGITPDQVLFVGSRLREDLVIAKSLGFRTALFAGEKLSLKATAADLKDPAVKPDRLLTQLIQVRDLLGI